MAADLHPDLVPFAALVGTWRGGGRGEYPTIDPFDYEEELTFEDVGDTFLPYSQRSWDPGDGSAIHIERGFLRPGEGGRVELTLAHPLGLTEIDEGTADAGRFEFATIEGGIGRTTTGMEVVGLVRRYVVDGDAMTYEIDMATESTPMARHLTGRLDRVD